MSLPSVLPIKCPAIRTQSNQNILRLQSPTAIRRRWIISFGYCLSCLVTKQETSHAAIETAGRDQMSSVHVTHVACVSPTGSTSRIRSRSDANNRIYRPAWYYLNVKRLRKLGDLANARLVRKCRPFNKWNTAGKSERARRSILECIMK